MKASDSSPPHLNLGQVAQKLKAKFIPVMLGAGLMLAGAGVAPEAAHALSGGRSGGSSFRSSSSYGRGSSSAMRSSYRGGGGGYNRGYGGGGMSLMPPIMPMYSPFGFYGGFMPINLNVLVLGFIAYTVFNTLSNRVGGSDFSSDDGTGMGGSSLGGGATVIKLQIALQSDWAESGNVMETLSRLAEKNSAMSNRSDLARLLSESSLALLRRVNDWDGAAFEGERFMMGPQKAEPYFQRLAIGERSKFEKETNGDSSGGVAMIKDSNDNSVSQPTQVVVSLVVAMRGQSTYSVLLLFLSCLLSASLY
jgi:uncharacterized membrane protein